MARLDVIDVKKEIRRDKTHDESQFSNLYRMMIFIQKNFNNTPFIRVTRIMKHKGILFLPVLILRVLFGPF